MSAETKTQTQTVALTCTGPSPHCTYVIERPITSSSRTAETAQQEVDEGKEIGTGTGTGTGTGKGKEHDVANARAVVTVTLKFETDETDGTDDENHITTLSFIIDGTQVLPWINCMAKGLRQDDSSTLYEVEGEAEVNDDTFKGENMIEKNKKKIVTLTIDYLSNMKSSNEEEEERKEASKTYKQAGNDLLKNGEIFKDYLRALLSYTRSLHLLDAQDEDSRISLRCNSSLLSLKMKEYTNSIVYSDAALYLLNHKTNELQQDYEKTNNLKAKALLRRALAYFHLGVPGYVRALRDITDVDDMKSNDVIIQREKVNIQTQVIKSLNKRKQEFAEVYSVMLQSPLFNNPLLLT